jgi:hypothetical protein
MKPLIKASLVVFFGLSLHSCSINRPISTLVPDNNKTYQVDYLFEHDGCKVYRFQDNGHYVYFTNCTGETASFRNDSIQTPVLNMIRKNPSK